MAQGTPPLIVHRYDSHTDSWNVVSQMKKKRSQCFAVTLPGDRIIVVGGSSIVVRLDFFGTDTVEILE